MKKHTVDGENTVSLCVWADMAPGLSYSLLETGPEAVDIHAMTRLL